MLYADAQSLFVALANPDLPSKKKLFLVFDVLDNWMSLDKWEVCDEALKDLAIETLPTEVIIGFVAATYPGKNKLPAREGLVKRLNMELKARGRDDLVGRLT